MDLLIRAALVITCDEARRVLPGAAVVLREGRIAAVGPADAMAQLHPTVPVMDARNLAVLPGFINAHVHTVLTVLRGAVEDRDGSAVYSIMSPVSYVMDGGERAAIATLGCLEAIRSGCTTLVEPFRHLPSYAGAMAATGLRLWLSESCADIDTRRIRHGDYTVDHAFGEAFLARAEEGIALFHGSHGGRVRCQVAAHAPDNCSPWMLGRLRDLAARHGLGRTVHLAQGMDEVRAVRAQHDATPAEYLDREGWLAPDLVGAHWTFCTATDVDLLAERGVQMAHNPANSSRRGPHTALLGRIRDAGVNIALGTDNMTQDMFQAMKIGLILHRGGRGRATEGGVDPQPQAMLDAVTRDAARSVGALDEIGSIEPGKRADLTLIDLRNPSLRPLIDPVSAIVHYGHPGVVHSVMADDAWLMHDRRVLTIDEDAAVDEAQAVTERVWMRMVRDNPDIPPPAHFGSAAGR
ncbi:MAG: amidohydrolase family protein [Acetobacteraceae bacterium]